MPSVKKIKAAAAPIPDEERHIARAKAGDKEAYRHLVEGYQDRVFGLVLSMINKREQAEDLTQEIFVKAYFALASFHGDSRFYTWLFRIAANHCLDYRRKRPPNEVSLDTPVDEDADISRLDTLQAPTTENPGATLEEEQSEMSVLLAGLEADQRMILSLRELEGFSYEEIAQTMKCGVNTVKSRLNRAREALKAAYAAKFGNIPIVKTVQETGENVP